MNEKSPRLSGPPRLSEVLIERLGEKPVEQKPVEYTLTVAEFRQVSYAIGGLLGLLMECHIPIQSAMKAQNVQAHANEAMGMLHKKNP